MTLHQVATAFRQSMPAKGNISVFQIDQLDRIGIPVVQAALILPDEPATIGYGYGFEVIEAEVGALGELCEEVHVGAWVKQAPRILGSYAELVRGRGADGVVDPLTLCLAAGSPYTPDMPLTWVEGRRLSNGKPVAVPREWVAAYSYQLGEPASLITPITNGLGAGLDLAHAIGHGLMELLQRDGNVVSFRALDQGVVVQPDAVDDQVTMALLDHLRSLGIDVIIKLASEDFGIANLYVVGNDRGTPTVPIQLTSCGEAAHPDRDRGLRKALLEFCGSRSRKAATHGPIDLIRSQLPPNYADRQMRAALLDEEESRALESMTEWVGQTTTELRRRLAGNVFAERKQVPLSALPTLSAESLSDPVARLKHLTRCLAQEDLHPIVIDASPPDSPVRVVKIIVPGLECETMSYHRIGWRGVRRLRARNDTLVVNAPRDGSLRVRMTPWDEEKAGGPAWFDVGQADRIVGQLYPLYRETGPFSAQLARQKRQAA